MSPFERKARLRVVVEANVVPLPLGNVARRAGLVVAKLAAVDIGVTGAALTRRSCVASCRLPIREPGFDVALVAARLTMGTSMLAPREGDVVERLDAERVGLLAVARNAVSCLKALRELTRVRILVALATQVGRSDETTRVERRVHGVTLTASDRSVSPTESEHLRVSLQAIPGRLEAVRIVAAQAATVALPELPTVNVLVASLAGFGPTFVVRTGRIRMPLVEREARRVTLSARYARVGTGKRKASSRVLIESHACRGRQPVRLLHEMARLTRSLELRPVGRRVTLAAGASPDVVERKRERGPRSVGRRQSMTRGAVETGVRPEEGKVIAVIEVHGRAELLLAMALTAGRGQASRVDVGVTVQTLLGQPQESRRARVLREVGELEWTRESIAVAALARGPRVGALEFELDMRMSESGFDLSTPRVLIDELEGLAAVFFMATSAVGFVGLSDEVVVALARTELRFDLVVTRKAPVLDPRLMMARLTAVESLQLTHLGVGDRERAGTG